MKKFLLFFAIIVIIGVIISLVLNYLNTGLNRESKEFVDKIVTQITTSWDPNLLIKNASPELLKSVSNKKIKESFKAFDKKLGSLEKYLGSSGEVGIYVKKETRIITATYSAKVKFKNTIAEIKIQLIKDANIWKIAVFSVKYK